MPCAPFYEILYAMFWDGHFAVCIVVADRLLPTLQPLFILYIYLLLYIRVVERVLLVAVNAYNNFQQDYSLLQ